MDQRVTFSDEFKAKYFSEILSKMCISHELYIESAVEFYIKYYPECASVVSPLYTGFEYGLSYYER